MIIQPQDQKTQQLIDSLRDKDHLNILFVCLGNICRSPAAQGLMQELVDERGIAQRFTIDSAGIGNWHAGQLPDPRMRAHARQRGLTLDHHARQVSSLDFSRFDLIIGMDSSNIDDLKTLAPTVEDLNKILPMATFFGNYSRFDHVPDPYYDGAQGFETVLDILTDATQNLLDTLS